MAKRESGSSNGARKRRLLNAAFAMFAALFLVSAAVLLFYGLDRRKARESFAQLEAIAQDAAQPRESGERAAQPSDAPRFAALTQRNPDFAGWLSIEGTRIQYPVMYTPAQPQYYLRRAFDGSYSISGVPFVGEGCTLGCNSLIIYGHNMKDGTMFSDLTKYADPAFGQAHTQIEFDTPQASGRYEVLAAFTAELTEGEGGFRYEAYTGELDPTRFAQYVAGAQAAAAYRTGVTAAYGDRLLTLSTCSYHAENGRFVVVAKRVGP